MLSVPPTPRTDVASQPNDLQRLLDRIDHRRYDTSEILDQLNSFSELPIDQQDSEEFGRAGFAGLDSAQHALADLCGEAHNDFAVVRDLDGSLVFLFETAPASGEWESGPFYRQHVSELELERYTEHDQSPYDYGVPLSRTELEALLGCLPDDPPGPLMSC